MKLILSRKVSWIFLIILFIFDSVVSYYAITQVKGREANLLIAYFVERYPLLYFIYIPGEIFIVYLIALVLQKLAKFIFKSFNQEDDTIERLVLSSLVIYWLIGNSSMNIMFTIGHKLKIIDWYKLSFLALIISICYFMLVIKKPSQRNVKIN